MGCHRCEFEFKLSIEHYCFEFHSPEVQKTLPSASDVERIVMYPLLILEGVSITGYRLEYTERNQTEISAAHLTGRTDFTYKSKILCEHYPILPLHRRDYSCHLEIRVRITKLLNN